MSYLNKTSIQKNRFPKFILLFSLTLTALKSIIIAQEVRSFTIYNWGAMEGSGAQINYNTKRFMFPSSNSEPWAGYWNNVINDSDFERFSFTYGGQITFTASVPSGESAEIYFRFEKNPYPDTSPSHDTDLELISGSNSQSYTIDIPPLTNKTFGSFIFYVVTQDVWVEMDNLVVTAYDGSGELPEPEVPIGYSDYYYPSGIQFYNNNFSFGQNVVSEELISWQQEIEYYDTHNQEIQSYVQGYVGLDDNDYLVLKIQRMGDTSFYSSRINTQKYNGIKVGPGERLRVEFEAQLPMAKDNLGNYIADVPLWPALWLMGNDGYDGTNINTWIGWPQCAEIDVMEWSPTKGPTGGASGYETQANVAYHWEHNGHAQYPSYYDEPDIHTKFHKWRVDIYRYNDGKTQKIEMYLNDQLVSGSRFLKNYSNAEFWEPAGNSNADKEYFLIMNIALGGGFTGVPRGDYISNNSLVPSNFDHAEMVIKNVSYQITSANNHILNLDYDPDKISVTKTPDQDEYSKYSSITVEATPTLGYLLSDTNWSSQEISISSDQSYNIQASQDTGDDDGDGLNNWEEATVYNSNLNKSDSDDDNSSDYFESIAGTSLTDPTDYFYLQGSMNLSGIYNLEYNSKLNRNYSIKISDNLVNWYDWKTESGDDTTHSNNFDPSIETISGLDSNSLNFFFKVDIEEQN